MLSCGDPEIAYRGRIAERGTGLPLAGVRVEYAPTEGVALTGPATTTTDSLGDFELEAPTAAAGQLSGTLRVLFDDGTVVDSVRDVTLSTSRAGDSRNLGRFEVAWPRFHGYGQLYHRATGQVAPGVQVEFRRTGGAEVEPDTFVVTSDAFGNFPLRPRPLQAQGEVVGEIILRPPAPFAPDTVRDIRFGPQLTRQPVPQLGRWGVGPVFPYLGRVLWSDGAPAAGVEVEFQRTGGIGVEPEHYVTTTVEWGGFNLRPVPLEPGEVEFTLTIRPPAPGAAVAIPYRMRTTHSESLVLIDTWVIPR